MELILWTLIGITAVFFVLLAMGVDSFVSAMTTMINGYYFSKRVYEEENKKVLKKEWLYHKPVFLRPTIIVNYQV